jgi:hypothetical protein
LKYDFRGQALLIDLAMNKYAVSDGRFKIVSERDFGFYVSDNELSYFNGNNATASMKIETTGKLALEIKNFSQDNMLWSQSSTDLNKYLINDLKKDNYYTISVNKQILRRIKSNADGCITFDYKTSKITDVIAIENK